MLCHVAVGAEGHKIIEGVVALLASFGFVVHLEILQRAALPASPVVPLQHPLHQSPVNLLSQAAGRSLKVQAVLTGRVVQHGDNLAVSVELVKVEDNTHIWGAEYSRSLSDLLALQGEITKNISDQLRLKLTGEAESRLAKRTTSNPEAFRLYLQGRYFSEKLTKEGVEKGLDYFHQALDLDPNYALAYEGTAYAYFVADDFYLAPRDCMPQAGEAAKKALELDESLAEAHVDMGFVDFSFNYAWAEGEKEFRRAISLKPDYAGAHEYLGMLLADEGRATEAIEESKRASDLAPLSAETNTIAGMNMYLAHANEQAIAQLDKALELDPNEWFARMFLGTAYEVKGDLPRAIQELQQAVKVVPEFPWPLAELGHAYAMAGKKHDAEEIQRKLEDWSQRSYVPAYCLAEVYVGLGDKARALAALEKGFQDRSIALGDVKSDPEFAGLASDPKFKDLLRRLGLPP